MTVPTGAGGSNAVEIVIRAQDAASRIIKGVGTAITGIAKASNFAASAVGKLTALTFVFNQWQIALTSVRAAFGQTFDALIGANERLQASLLSTQASLAATGRVLQNGVDISAPLEAIQALEGPVAQAIEKIREESFELSGVTSSELIPVFQILARNAAAMGANLDEAASLTADAAAAFSVLQIPIFQANQELQSIAQGYIDHNSILARTLNLSNDQIAAWKAQGTVVENLRAKLAAFREANKLQAKTLTGALSNIREILEETLRLAGKPLLAPLVEGVNQLYDRLKTIRPQLERTFTGVSKFVVDLGSRLVAALEPIKPALRDIGVVLRNTFVQLARLVGTNLDAIVTGIGALVKATAPLINAFTPLAKTISEFLNTELGQMAATTIALTFAFSKLGPVLAALGTEALSTVIALGGLQKALIALSKGGLLSFIGGFGRAAAALRVFAKSSLLVKVLGIEKPLLAASKAIFKMSAAAKAGTLSLKVLGTQLKALAISAASAAAPVALLAAGLTTIALIRARKNLEETNRTVDSFQASATQSAAEARRLAAELKKLAEIEENGGTLNPEQIERRKLLSRLAGEAAEDNKELADSIRASAAAIKDPSAKNALIALADEIEGNNKLLGKWSSGVVVAGQKVQELGNKLRELQGEIKRTTQTTETESAQQIAALTEGLASGAIDKNSFAKARAEATQAALTAQIEAIERAVTTARAQYSRLTDEEKANARDLESEILSLEKEAAEKRTSLRENELAERDRQFRESISQAESAITLAESQRLASLQRLRNQGLISDRKLESEKLKATQDRVNEELRLEQRKLKQLQASGFAEADEIRAAQQRVAQLTQQLLENQKAQTDAFVEAIKSKLQNLALGYANALEEGSQALQRQQSLLDAQAQALDSRNRLLQAGVELRRSATSLITGEIDALASIEKSEYRRRELARIAAALKLEAAKQESEIARQTLEIESQKNRLLQQRQRIENEIAQSKQRADIATGAAELAGARADLEAGNVSEQQFRQLELAQRSRLDVLAQLQQQGQLLQQQAAQQVEVESLQRRALENRNRLRETQAKSEIVSTAPPGQRRALQNSLQSEVARNFGFKDFRDLLRQQNQQADRLREREFFGRGRGGSPLGRVGGNVPLPTLDRVPIPQTIKLQADPQLQQTLQVISAQARQIIPAGGQRAALPQQRGQSDRALAAIAKFTQQQARSQQPPSITATFGDIKVQASDNRTGDAIATEVDKRLRDTFSRARVLAGAGQ